MDSLFGFIELLHRRLSLCSADRAGDLRGHSLRSSPIPTLELIVWIGLGSTVPDVDAAPKRKKQLLLVMLRKDS